MKPIIGIIGRVNKEKASKPTISVLDNYRNAIIKAGGIPILILPPQPIEYEDTLPKDTSPLTDQDIQILNEQLKLVNGILMPGGHRMYEYDLYIANFANEHSIPLFGICLGMQIMSKLNNNNLNQKIDTDIHNQKDKDYVHEVNINKNSLFYSIVKEESFKVNSHHNYKITDSGSYDIVGYSNDNIIEVIEKKNNNFNIGVQWHPEKNYDNDIISQRLFIYFIEQAKKTTN